MAEQEELLAKALKKKKSPSKKKAAAKKAEPEEPEEVRPPGDPYLMGELRDTMRAERHEYRQQHLIEAMAIKQHLSSQSVHHVPLKVIESGISLSEDEILPKRF